MLAVRLDPHTNAARKYGIRRHAQQGRTRRAARPGESNPDAAPYA